ncbi:hypothetical protein PSPTOT1_4343 [Pseudomonas syringae pv. tomato T1]|nr:hypothetical protein PSPTOT1_4343 [Pseudomonas syringae pv. tomato T1]
MKKLAQLLLSLLHNKNKKRRSKPIKTRRNGSDITRTKRTEAQLTDFFGVDQLYRDLSVKGLATGQRTIKLPSGSSRTGGIRLLCRQMIKANQRSKKYVCS